MRSLRASSIAYAVLFMLFIGAVTSSIILVNSSHKMIESNNRVKENVIFNSFNAINYFLNSKDPQTQIVNISQDTSLVSIQKWGVWNLIRTETFNKNNRYSTRALFGIKNNSNYPSLYLSDKDQSLQLAGNSKIKGKTYLPKRGVERAYITGKPFVPNNLVEGKILKSEKNLPSINDNNCSIDIGFYKHSSKQLELYQIDSSLDKDSIYFVEDIIPIYIADSIDKRVIIHSYDSITVSKDAYLKNVILVAPTIRIEKGFKGSGQFFSKDRIILEDEVTLEYPSALVLNEENAAKSNGIYIGENSIVAGGVLLRSDAKDFRSPCRFVLEKDGLMMGIIYNAGVSDIKGEILGSLYTDKLEARTKSSIYSNHLIDARISNSELPRDFVYPDWIKFEGDKKKEILEWL